MTLNEAYATYKLSPSETNREVLGVELYQYLKSMVAKKYSSESYQFDDVIEDTFVALWEMIDDLELKTAKFSSYVGSAIYNRCIDKFKQSKLIQADLSSLSSNPLSTDGKISLYDLINQLSYERKVLIKLKLEGYEDTEIAIQLGKDVRWVTNNYIRAVEDMKKMTHTPDPQRAGIGEKVNII